MQQVTKPGAGGDDLLPKLPRLIDQIGSAPPADGNETTQDGEGDDRQCGMRRQTRDLAQPVGGAAQRHRDQDRGKDQQDDVAQEPQHSQQQRKANPAPDPVSG